MRSERSREHYEAQKAQRQAREKRKHEAQKQKEREAELAGLWFWRHPDKVVRYTGWLQLYTLILSVATLLLFGATVISAIILHSTDDAIRGQLAQMKAEQRAWLSLDIVGAKLDIFRNRLPDIDFEIKIKNVGKTPARGIVFQPQIQEPPKVGDYSKSIIENCPHTMPFTEEYGTFLVPGDKIVRRIPIMGYRPAQLARAWSPPGEQKKVFDINTIICVWYKTTLDEETHITGAVIWIRKSTDDAHPEYSIEAKYGD